jgi:hypothetical protein
MFLNTKSLFQTLHILPLLSAHVDAYRPAAAGQGHGFLHRRQAIATTMTPVTTYTVITPSPSASTVAVTSLGQIVTSYIPQITLCAIDSPSTSSTPTQWRNDSSNALARRTTSLSHCTTSYSTTVLTVCATTLQGLGSTIAITDCNQNVTFSSNYGYSLIPPSTTTSSFDGTGLPQTTITAPASINTITVSPVPHRTVHATPSVPSQLHQLIGFLKPKSPTTSPPGAP